MKSFIKSAVLAASIALASSFAYAGEPRTSLTVDDTRGEISFKSVHAHTLVRDLQKEGLVLDTTISGVISFPSTFFGRVTATSESKVPAMILMHGSDGPYNPAFKQWADYLNGLGVATFIVDAFSGRGIRSTAEDQSQMDREPGAVDALLAMKLLATHPFIDAKRIGAMGFSKGGVSAQMASFQILNDLVLGKNSDLKLAGHIGFYGGCTAMGKTTGAPVLILAGELDDGLQPAKCQYVYELMKQTGANVRLIVYPNAFHAFDQGNKQVLHAKVKTTPDCSPVVDYDTGGLFIPNGSQPMKSVPRSERKNAPFCPTHGPMGLRTGANPDAHAASKKEVASFIDTYMR
jgi:dienelactone hydrolase